MSRIRSAAAIIPVVVVLAVAAVSCSKDSSRDTTTSTERTTSTTGSPDDGKAPVTVPAPGPVTLQPGQRAVIELEANNTTGYQWAPTAEPNAKVVTVVSDTYVAPGSQLAGAGGTQRIVIEGVAAGTTTLSLGYARPWEQGVPPVKTATYDITVG
jgi:predicted secreted protein